MNNNLVTILAVGVLLVVGAVSVFKDPVTVQVVSPDGNVQVVERGGGIGGASAGPDHYNHEYFYAGLTTGGFVVSTSTSANSTLVAGDLVRTDGRVVTRIEVTPTAGNVTLTLPASSTIPHIAPSDGDTVTFLIENEATAATTTTIAAGAGMDLQEPDGQNVVIGQNNFAWVTLQRDENGDFIVLIDESIPAD